MQLLSKTCLSVILIAGLTMPGASPMLKNYVNKFFKINNFQKHAFSKNILLFKKNNKQTKITKELVISEPYQKIIDGFAKNITTIHFQEKFEQEALVAYYKNFITFLSKEFYDNKIGQQETQAHLMALIMRVHEWLHYNKDNKQELEAPSGYYSSSNDGYWEGFLHGQLLAPNQNNQSSYSSGSFNYGSSNSYHEKEPDKDDKIEEEVNFDNNNDFNVPLDDSGLVSDIFNGIGHAASSVGDTVGNVVSGIGGLFE